MSTREKDKEYDKRYWERHGEEQKKKQNDTHRKYYLVIKGKRVKGIKRPFPADGKCEVCPKKPKFLHYHHWDDSNFQRGIWLCDWCHILAEKVDDNLHTKYLQLREKIDEVCKRLS